MNENAVVTLLIKEIQGCTHIYDCYLDTAFKKVTHGKDLTNIDPEAVKRKALEVLGFA